MKRIAFSVLCVLAASCGAPLEGADRPVAGTSTPVTATVVDEVVTSTAPTPTEPPSPAVPWLEPALFPDELPEVLIEQWNQAANRTWCSALFPQDAESLGQEAAIRSANFAGGWAVAWDLPDGPGRHATGEYCSDCGRGVYGVAGVGTPVYGDEADRWPTTIRYDDGSIAGYGYEGDGAATAGAPLLTYLLVQGEGCIYNVWSFLGEDHLLELLSLLRRVSGLEGEPTAWQSQLPPPELVALGEPPWAGPVLAADEVPEIAHDEWAESGSDLSCPMLYFADLGAAAGASIRHAANSGEMLVAWDLPDGPGHSGDGLPCDDCGRGVVGLGTFPRASYGGPVAYTWSDGSEARLRTGPYHYGTESFLRITGFTCDYWLWSHLGAEHLEYLFSQLRLVAAG